MRAKPLKQEIVFFESPAALRRWFGKYQDTKTELWVGFYKKGSGRPSITWPECVDEALCYGWIDGIRKSLDDISYVIRLTPRKPRSIWSAVNIRHANRLIAAGLMQPSGLKAFEARREDPSRIYSHEREKHKLGRPYVTRLKANRKAWEFFRSQPPWYQRTASFWVISAKKEETRLKRLDALIRDSANGRPIGPLNRKKTTTS